MFCYSAFGALFFVDLDVRRVEYTRGNKQEPYMALGLDDKKRNICFSNKGTSPLFEFIVFWSFGGTCRVSNVCAKGLHKYTIIYIYMYVCLSKSPGIYIYIYTYPV